MFSATAHRSYHAAAVVARGRVAVCAKPVAIGSWSAVMPFQGIDLVDTQNLGPRRFGDNSP